MSVTPEIPPHDLQPVPHMDTAMLSRLVHEEYVKKGTRGLYSRWKVYDYATEPLDYYGEAYRALSCTPMDTLLDIGCADGHGLASFARLKGHTGLLFGVDLDTAFEDPRNTESMFATALRTNRLHRAHNVPTVSYAAASAEFLPLADDSVDGTTILFMLYHLDDQAQALQEAIRVTKSLGRIVIASSGPDNKVREREFEPQIAEWLSQHTGKLYKPPHRFTENFDIETAEEVLPDYLRIIRTVAQGGFLRIDPGYSYMHYVNSLSSRREHYINDHDSRPPSKKLWNRAVRQVVLKAMRQEFNQQGHFDDIVQRKLFVCENPK